MIPIRIVGVDPGFANIGISIIELFSVGVSTIVDTRSIVTQTYKGKINKLDDELRRLNYIEDQFTQFIDGYSPHIMAIEEPGKCLMRRRNHITKKTEWATNAALLRTSCLMWGAVHGICRARGIYCIKIGSQDIKKTLTNKRSASKQEIVDVIKSRYPEFNNWPKGKKIEHVADSIGAAITSFNDPTVIALLRSE